MNEETSPRPDVSAVSIRDASRRIASQLRGELRSRARGFYVQLTRPETGRHLRLAIAPTPNDPSLMNLTVESGETGRDDTNMHLSYQNIAHLYITWDTPHQVSFCYVQETHFYVVNVSQDMSIRVFCDRDRRLEETEGLQPDTLRQRRAFHHVGSVEDQGDPHNAL